MKGQAKVSDIVGVLILVGILIFSFSKIFAIGSKQIALQYARMSGEFIARELASLSTLLGAVEKGEIKYELPIQTEFEIFIKDRVIKVKPRLAREVGSDYSGFEIKEASFIAENEIWIRKNAIEVFE